MSSSSKSSAASKYIPSSGVIFGVLIEGVTAAENLSRDDESILPKSAGSTPEGSKSKSSSSKTLLISSNC